MPSRSLSHSSNPDGAQLPELSPAREHGGEALATMLLAAFVAALVAAANSVVDSYADGHLLIGWVVLWTVGFAAIALSAGAARNAALRLSHMVGHWAQQRTLRHADAYLMAVARNNPALMADIEAAQARAETDSRLMDQALGRAWLARHPVGTFNATYQGRHNNFQTTPLAGLPAHMQYLRS